MKRNYRKEARIDAAAFLAVNIIVSTLLLVTSTIAVIAFLQLERLT